MLGKFQTFFKDLAGEAHEVSESIIETLNERLTSPFYGYFIISWLIVNWDYVYSAFFVSDTLIYEKTGLLKNEYLLQAILPGHYSLPWYWLNFLIIPLFFSFIALWAMPYITRLFFRKHLRNKIKLEQIKAKEMIAETKVEQEILEAEAKKAKVELEVAKTSPEVLWKNEYEKFTNHKLYKKFKEIIDYYYNHGSRKSYWRSSSDNGTVSQDIWVFCDVNGIIEVNGDSFEMTKKGREFVKLFINDNPDYDAPF